MTAMKRSISQVKLECRDRRPSHLLLLQGRGHAAEIGVLPVATTTALAVPLSTLVPRNAMMRRAIGASPLARSSRRGLFHREALAGERPLDHEQVLRLHDAHVAGNHVARRELHHIARNQIVQTAISWAAPSRDTVAVTEIIALSFAAALVGPGLLNQFQADARGRSWTASRARTGRRRSRTRSSPAPPAGAPAGCAARARAVCRIPGR